MKEGELVPGNKWEMIARGFPNEHQHEAKPMEFDGEGNMYVNVGAPANACMEQMRTKGSPGMDPCPLLEYAGGTWKFKDDMLNQDQLADGVRYATGIRNGMANCWNTAVNELYIVQHGRDQLNQFFPDMYDTKQSAELPAEEFFLVTEGSDFGWPYCYYDQLQNKKVLAPEYGGDGIIQERCENKTDPIMAFPGHMAPNDLLFYTGDMFPEKYKNGAFIAFHGSWNRAPEPQKGFFVVFVPFKGSLPSGDWEVFADGFAGTDKIENTGDAKYRPCGLAQGPDGSLYVVEDNHGKIWRIFYQS
jgi:glucose/arabinose dehydrogenase